ncbi:MAG: helix-turn-helix transcriptional regulator [Dehalococcoidia bacterium]|nr:helix-turn-helix transcriptional regulator [Dehalococcoidia bacterium]
MLTLALAGHTQPEMADRLGLDLNGVRSHVRWLKEFTGCRNLRALGPWWLAHRERWLAVHAALAGLPPPGHVP